MSAAAPATPPAPAAPTELTVVSHSSLFYWWPIWAIGFLMGILTFLDKHRMVVVPEDTRVYRAVAGKVEQPNGENLEFGVAGDKGKPARDVLIMQEKSLVDAKGVPLDEPLKLH